MNVAHRLQTAKPLAGKWPQLGIVFAVVLALSAAISHLVAAHLGIETSTGKFWEIQPSKIDTVGYMAGSSLANGIDWGNVATASSASLRGWGVGGSSPWEWESFQAAVPDVGVTFLVVSAYDLNEHFLCDFHADVVPFTKTAGDLLKSEAGWAFTKRAMSQYPLYYLRNLYPTAGRAQGVMEGTRDILRALWSPRVSAAPTEVSPRLGVGEPAAADDYKKETIRDWTPARMLRRKASMRAACQGNQSFSGPKQLSFYRMLDYARERGRVVVVVLPVSPSYKGEFLNEAVTAQFEGALARAKGSFPEAQWLRLDTLPELDSDEYFFDLVHINTLGRPIATAAFFSRMEQASRGLTDPK